MTVIFAALGAAFAWLVRTGWQRHLAGETRARRARCRAQRMHELYVLAVLVFSAVSIVLAMGIYGRAQGEWAWWPVVLLWYLKLPSVLSSIAAFVLAAALVIKWPAIKAFATWLYESHGNPPPAPAEAAAKGPSAWIASIVGIAGVTLVGVVTVAIFFPEVMMRIETIKVAGLEARFAATASHTQSYRTGVEAAINVQPLTASIGQFENYEKTRKLDLAAQTIVTAGWLVSEAEKQETRDVIDAGETFLSKIAVPLGKVINCYGKDFDIRDTEIRHKLVSVANEWARVFQGEKERLDKAIRGVVELTLLVDYDLVTRGPKCNKNDQIWQALWVTGQISEDQLKQHLDAKTTEISAAIQPYFDRLNQNAWAANFVIQLNVAARKPFELIKLADKLEMKFGNRRGTLVAQSFFQTGRYQLGFAANQRAAKSIDDLRPALIQTEEIIAAVSQCQGKAGDGEGAVAKACRIVRDQDKVDINDIIDRFSLRRVGILNNMLYTWIWDWLNGRPLSAHQVMELEGAPTGGHHFELSTWAEKQSVGALRNRNATGDEAASEKLSYVSAVYDTLAMRDLALGTIKNDMSAERCARAKSAFKRALEAQKDDETVLAHHDLFESLCRN